MPEITLASYMGYLVQELVKAREMADAYSRQVAQQYGEDIVLQHFSVPRFKIPKIELTVPVLVTGARFRRTVRFRLDDKEFLVAAQAIRKDLLRQIAVLAGEPFSINADDPSPMADDQLLRMYHELSANPRPEEPTALTGLAWARVIAATLEEHKISELYVKLDPDRRISRKNTSQVLRFVQEGTVVERTELDSLLVDPETTAVKQVSTEISVFTVKAELAEDSFFLRSVTDERTGEKHTIVEFD